MGPREHERVRQVGNPEVESEITVAREVVFGRGGEKDLLLDLYRPSGHADLPLPVVVFIHGGGWHGGDKKDYGDLATHLARHGYLCAAINYRLSGEAPFPAALEDCKCAIRWLRAHADDYNADPHRFATWGHSAGGHLAAMVALTPGQFEGQGGWAHAPSVAQCALCFSAPLDFPALGESLKGSVDAFLGAASAGDRGGRERSSPISYVAGATAAFFICHGEQDNLVPPEQSQRFVAALRKAKVAVEFMPVPTAGHDLERHSPDIFARAVRFLDRHLKRPAESC